jgi:hypothetical protein
VKLSESGRVVLIDDNYGEIEALVKTLGKNGVPYLYFDGSMNHLPESPLGGVRFVFLDIELADTKGQPSKNKASKIVNVLGKIISADNGPFVIIFWTKHEEDKTQVISNCSKLSIAPIAYLSLEKLKCMNSDIDYITSSLQECLKDIETFLLYTEWENIINTSAKKQISALTECFEDDSNLKEKTEFLFYKLSDSFNNTSDDNSEKIKSLFYMLNRALVSKLEEEVNNTSISLMLPDHKSIPKDQFNKHFISDFGSKYELSGEQYIIKESETADSRHRLAKKYNKKISDIIGNNSIAKLNKSLLVNNNPSVTGSIYMAEDDTIKDSLLKDIFTQEPPDAILCKVLITPECDLAQKKVLLINRKEKVHRVIYGIMYKSSASVKLTDSGKDARFSFGPVWHKDNSHEFIFHFATLSLESEVKLQGSPIFTLRRDLIFDLQSKAANHVNRLGNLLLS